ncbi:MAG: pantoate--beta-alanine ligase [Rhodospirillales bacterium]|jgi:pantoate--beta-alanine ligase|nr:pantoate--beta-alanine ligase [Rhodospirillales bacterium]MDP7624091.1 pantoate--beta-alanine ligase [Rhodospirillales bacterium]
MSNDIEIVRTVADLRQRLTAWRQDGLTVGLVPTMGALHDGHFSLVEQAVQSNDRTITSLFVNPKQFGSTEDLDVYPRDEATDVAALAARGVDLLFAPNVEEMYPDSAVTAITVPGIGDVLEGAFRPGFFTGVATVVAKLLIQSLPDRAYFGEKDYQQLCVIKRLTKDLDLPIDIAGCPIVREPDGLALSSRNAYLNAGERQAAPALHQTLVSTGDALAKGAAVAASVSTATTELLNAGFTKVDYIAVCDPASLEELEKVSGQARLLAAAWLGKTRLIDNIAIEI